jgi:predicted RNA-binding protein associated with RNAse of E/G family
MTVTLSNLTYHRLPDKRTEFTIALLQDDAQGVVMGMYLNPSKPVTIENTVVLDHGFMGIFYCSYHDWYDIGAIYNREKQFQGYYCDICSPIQKIPNGYEMTDFFLDVWVTPDNHYTLLDEEEFTHAITHNWLTSHQITNAKNKLSTLIHAIESHHFSPEDIKPLLMLPRHIDEIIEALRNRPKENY